MLGLVVAIDRVDQSHSIRQGGGPSKICHWESLALQGLEIQTQGVRLRRVEIRRKMGGKVRGGDLEYIGVFSSGEDAFLNSACGEKGVWSWSPPLLRSGGRRRMIDVK